MIALLSMPSIVNKTPRKVPVRKYRYVTLPLVSLFRKSNIADDEDGSELKATLVGKYFITPFKGSGGAAEARNVPVILNPDGSIWKHGTLYILARATDFDAPSDQTLKGYAKGLVDYMNTLAQDGVDYLATPKMNRRAPDIPLQGRVKP